jgi:hypothetical protein
MLSAGLCLPAAEKVGLLLAHIQIHRTASRLQLRTTFASLPSDSTPKCHHLQGTRARARHPLAAKAATISRIRIQPKKHPNSSRAATYKIDHRQPQRMFTAAKLKDAIDAKLPEKLRAMVPNCSGAQIVQQTLYVKRSDVKMRIGSIKDSASGDDKYQVFWAVMKEPCQVLYIRTDGQHDYQLKEEDYGTSILDEPFCHLKLEEKDYTELALDSLVAAMFTLSGHWSAFIYDLNDDAQISLEACVDAIRDIAAGRKEMANKKNFDKHGEYFEIDHDAESLFYSGATSVVEVKHRDPDLEDGVRSLTWSPYQPEFMSLTFTSTAATED